MIRKNRKMELMLSVLTLDNSPVWLKSLSFLTISLTLSSVIFIGVVNAQSDPSAVVWELVSGSIVRHVSQECGINPIFGAVDDDIEWIAVSPQIIIDPGDELPEGIDSVVSRNTSRRYSLIVLTNDEGEHIIAIYDTEESEYVDIKDALQSMLPIAFAWRPEHTQLTILGQYEFNFVYVILNYDVEDGTITIISESQDPTLLCSHVRWLGEDQLLISENETYGDEDIGYIIDISEDSQNSFEYLPTKEASP